MSCIFCQIVSRQSPAQIVFEDSKFLAFLDKYPQTRGHLQLIPKEHFTWIYDLPHIDEFFLTAQKIIRGIIPVLGADHVTLASFGHEVKHAHLWIVPQYKRTVRLEEGAGREEDINKLTEVLRNALMKSA